MSSLRDYRNNFASHYCSKCSRVNKYRHYFRAYCYSFDLALSMVVELNLALLMAVVAYCPVGYVYYLVGSDRL